MLNSYISRLSVKKKLSLIIVILLSSIFITFSIIISVFFISVNSTLQSGLDSSSKNFNNSFSYFSKQLRIYGKMISNNLDIRRGTYFNNTGAILNYITPVKTEIGIDIIDIHNVESVIIARAHDPEEFNIKNNTQYIEIAKKGRNVTYIEKSGEYFFLKNTSPIFHINSTSRLVGTVTVGYKLNNRFAEELKKISNTDILFINNSNIYASSFLDKIKYPLKITDNDKLNLNTKVEYDIIRTNVSVQKPENFKIYFAVDNSGLRKTFKTVILIIIIFFFLIAFLSLWLTIKIGNNVKKSIEVIHSSTREIEKENYVLKIDLDTKDEFKDLADTLNLMTENIDTSFKTIKKQTDEIEGLTDFLSNLIESMPSILISIDKDGYITQLNNTAAESFKLDSQQSLGKILWDILPEFDKYKKFIDIIISEQRSIELFKEKFEGEEKFIYNISLFPIKTKGVGLRIDNISELEKKEEQLRQSQKMEIVGTLAGGLAHDFNNVLGGIFGALSMIQINIQKTPDIISINIIRYIDLIKESTERAADMVNQLLSISRKSSLEFSIIDLNNSITRVIKVLKTTIDKKIVIKSELNSQSSTILGNANQIDQVLLNLCVNASQAMTIMKKDKYGFGGQLDLKVNYIPASIQFTLIHPEAENIAYWELSVSDTGVGMNNEVITKIFDPFFTTKTKETGTGLGLSMVYNIVKEHKGFIEVNSEKDSGTVFNLYFPVNKGLKDEEDMKDEKIIYGDGLVLIIDDEIIMQDIVKEILEECGYKTITASNGEEGIDHYKEKHKDIDIILLDMSMPGLSGKETFVKLKEINRDVKVLIVSGHRQENKIKEVLKLGALKFLQKPYTIYSLSSAVQEVIKL